MSRVLGCDVTIGASDALRAELGSSMFGFHPTDDEHRVYPYTQSAIISCLAKDQVSVWREKRERTGGGIMMMRSARQLMA